MAISNIYVYFNEKGEVVSKAPYLVGGNVTQGSDFKLNILFDKDTVLIGDNGIITVEFKCPGQTKYNLFPFVSFYDKYINEGSQNLDPSKLVFTRVGNKTFEESLTKYGIEAGKEYQCWTFDSSIAYEGGEILTERDGNLEVQVKIINNTTTSSSSSWTNSTKALGTFRIFVEKTLYHESPFNVSQMDLNRFLNEMEIITKTRGFGIHLFKIDEETGELVVLAERSDDLAEKSYEINENGELVIKI